jgi:hypothetical protein
LDFHLFLGLLFFFTLVTFSFFVIVSFPVGYTVGQLLVDDCFFKWDDGVTYIKLDSRAEVIVQVLDATLKVYFTAC